ncbi:ClpXP protease specificity-enhancing factor SspB [Rhodoblastus acidophilus]|uniref:ClpXP protease specificity-enhancing factor SspB n=1 Tax=Candidatus Rhodoblastus alkanivorans TaxID=2954117 RepID=A0ABS9Z8S9_9HYPH|nr:ClpXP protease specificity-enhancing factor SspB [Candidatus Rhodoblastus alkanivorans]MCI4679320.1 ClpXP protease specificity-enhancing factor SspB [Candidatus Rhodoblastus alkanivorans]MCI4684053.1 ClpXP protease specificity-enhancing factor SspB [Candidatus Rhodoblastus alkanivorans]MDI4641373.1 ClpXP protease specificity-enhancing factor SspB [Rhodoblastus acidophilus]
MPTDVIRYDLQVQDALRGVVRKVLADAARDGLPGEHHFYITFRTHAPGVNLSARLREQYPDEMTIILQYQFWDLQVDDESFEVGLHFKNIPERLHIPFEAITGFYDPSVQFGLKFEALSEDDEEMGFEDDDQDEEAVVESIANRPGAAPESESEKSRPRGAASEPEVLPAKSGLAESAKANAGRGKAEDKPAQAGASADGEESKVVSIDAFRKKT